MEGNKEAEAGSGAKGSDIAERKKGNWVMMSRNVELRSVLKRERERERWGNEKCGR